MLEPNNPVIFFQLGLLRYNNENYEEAINSLERAVVLNNVYANAKYFLGLAYYYAGRTGDAIDQFEQVAETNPENEGVKLILANLEAGDDPLAGLREDVQDQGVPPIGGE